VTTSAASSSDEDTLTRDAFGFRQIIVAATSYGKIFGIDSSDGRVLWSRVLGLGWAAKVGGAIIPTKIFVTRTVSDPEGPQIVLVTQRRADNVSHNLVPAKIHVDAAQSLVDTVLFHVNALTGDDVREEHQSIPRTALEGLDAVMGPLVDVFMLPSENRTIVMLDEYLQVCCVPLLESASLTVNRRAFTQILHPLRLSSNHSSHPYISLSARMCLVSVRSWVINSASISNCLSSMLPIQHGHFHYRQKRKFAP
jgi:hypothetical protein